MQTRSINKHSQAEAQYAFVEAMAQVNMVIAQSTERASIWRRGLESFEELTEEECMQLFMFVGRFSKLW